MDLSKYDRRRFRRITYEKIAVAIEEASLNIENELVDKLDSLAGDERCIALLIALGYQDKQIEDIMSLYPEYFYTTMANNLCTFIGDERIWLLLSPRNTFLCDMNKDCDAIGGWRIFASEYCDMRLTRNEIFAIAVRVFKQQFSSVEQTLVQLVSFLNGNKIVIDMEEEFNDLDTLNIGDVVIHPEAVEMVGIAVFPQVNCDEELEEEKGFHYALPEEVKVDPQTGDVVYDVTSPREANLFFDCNDAIHCENADFRDGIRNVYKHLIVDCDDDQLFGLLAPYIKDIRSIARVNSVFLNFFKHVAVMRFRGVKFRYSTIQFNAQGLPYLSCVRMYGEPKSRVYNVRVGIVQLRYGKKWFNFTDSVRRSLYLEGHYYNIIMKDHRVLSVIGITDTPLYTVVKLQANYVLTLCMGDRKSVV